MAEPITFGIYNADGSAKTDATPSYVAFVSRAGAARTRPGGGAGTILNLTRGKYGLTPSDSDESVGTIYVIDCGATSLPRYVYGEIHSADNEFAAIVVFNSDGTLGSGAPTLESYVDIDGTDVTPEPSIDAAGAIAYLYSVSPSLADLEAGAFGRVELPAGKLPASVDVEFFAREVGTTSGPPTATLVSQPADTLAGRLEPFVIDVDDDVGLRRVVFLAEFEGIPRQDSVFDGDVFSDPYLVAGSTRVATLTGYRFTIYRQGGWPYGRTTNLNVIGIDTDGSEAE